MICKCGGETYVIDSRLKEDNTVRRRRQCENPKCRDKFTTHEMHVDTDYITDFGQLPVGCQLKELQRFIKIIMENQE